MNEDILNLLATLPPQYPVEQIQGNGFSESVNAFVNLNTATNLAYFTESGGGLVVVDATQVTLIDFPSV